MSTCLVAAAPPTVGAPGAAARIRRAEHRVFGQGRDYRRDPRRLRHYRDLLAPFGVQFDEGLLGGGRQNGFHSMGEALMGQMRLTESLDLIVLAHSIPDSEPELSTASHLAYRSPGEPRAFAICDAGVGAPFAALKVIAAHLRRTGGASALLIVLDQTTLPNFDPHVHSAPVDDTAVGILLGAADGRATDGRPPNGRAADGKRTDGRAADGILRWDGVRRTEVPGLIDGMVATRGPGRRVAVVTGPAVPTARVDSAGVIVHRASDRHVCTAVWVELSRHLSRWRSLIDDVLLVDYDGELGQLHAATVRLTPGDDVP